ncbi:PDCD5-related protein [Kockovaella imperatae]|uniref:PDCD5-related protein n=1 Tax=Kockovaella imperatae TaxID=4999 RepID=A0A1Y1UEI6_9TREE|nr:PDCD5-related protein [Kockovaella imperatae]ORX36471.1 PDCD5-related protein [Kockovaella imperatae]
MSNFQLPQGLRPAAPPSGAGPSGLSGGASGAGTAGGQGSSEQEQAAARERAQAQEEMKRTMIQAMLDSAARERLSRISLTRPQLAAQVEELLVRMGTSGQIRGQVSDDALKNLLEQVSNPPQAKTGAAPTVSTTGARTKSLGAGITIQRKRDDSDSDEYDL